MWYIGMFGTMAFASVMLYYKPDTRCATKSSLYPNLLFTNNFWDSVQTWALQEAKERMEARGEKYQYESQPSTPP